MTTSPRPPPPTASAAGRRALRATIGICGVIFIAYLPLWHAGFVWNDNDYVTRSDLRTFAGLIRIWTDVGATEQYYPLLHSAFWVEHKLWGDAALGYHLINVLFHACSACVLALILGRLAVPGAWLAGLIFALHPVCVESVAWIAEQKNTLSTLFYLAAMLLYLHFDKTRLRRHYFSGLALFFCALLTKSATAPLPAALLVIFWWKRGRLSWREDIAPLVPWFLIGALIGLFTAWVEKFVVRADTGGLPVTPLTGLEHVLLASRIIWFYLGKLCWPGDLIFIYPHWTIRTEDVSNYFYLLGVVALFVASWALRKRTRAPLAALLFFTGTLFPVLGFLSVYGFNFSFVADHWQYLPSLGMIAVAGATLGVVSAQVGQFGVPAVGLMLGSLSWHQSQMYETVERLYRTILAKNPGCFMATMNLSTVLFEQGHSEEGIELARKAVELMPGYAPPYYQLGSALARKGSIAEAIPMLEKAAHLRPWFTEAQNALGVALLSAGRPREAQNHLELALRLNPGLKDAARPLATIYYQSGTALGAQGHTADAIPLLEKAVGLWPDFAEAHENLGIGLFLTGNSREAESHLVLALHLKPDLEYAERTLAQLRSSASRPPEPLPLGR